VDHPTYKTNLDLGGIRSEKPLLQEKDFYQRCPLGHSPMMCKADVVICIDRGSRQCDLHITVGIITASQELAGVS